MKKKYLLMVLAGALMLSTMVGGTLAALDTATTEGTTADISVKSIGVSMNSKDGFQTVDGNIEIENGAVPGGDYPCSYNVCNSEAEGYDIYVKVSLYKYWADEDERLESKYDSIYYCDEETDGNKKTYPDSLEEFVITENDWLVQYADDEQIVLYYTKPLKASKNGEESISTNFMDGVSFDAAIGNAYANKQLQLEYEVTAVQANNSQAAMAAEWGMFPVFDENGILTGVYETEAEAMAQSAGNAQ